ncbi:MAG: segregation/condensation protein A, partial [Turicibacter sp.]|nr:segregation/condensation protein A [Turicibacter sp.]
QLKYKKRVSFVSLFERFDKEYIVVTFLALLELVKGNQISISQQNYYEDIYISSLEGDEVV